MLYDRPKWKSEWEQAQQHSLYDLSSPEAVVS